MKNGGVKIGLSGLEGVGKTETLLKVANRLMEKNIKVGGVITQTIRDANEVIGFDIMDWPTTMRGVLARTEPISQIRMGKFYIDQKTLSDIGANAVKNASENADLVIIDEIGKIQVRSEDFVDSVKKVLDTDKSMLMTMHKKSRNPLLQDIRRRDDVRIIEVTTVSRTVLSYNVEKLLEKSLR